MVNRPLVPPAEVVASDGRVPGNRGLATRARLLDATAVRLAAVGYRDLKVVDVAKEAGTSPATFYQYFPDVDAALLSLAAALAEEGGRHLRSLVTDAPWDHDPASAALAVADGVLDFWSGNEELIRVVDHAALEGDDRFRNLRTWMLNGIFRAFDEVVARPGAPSLDPSAAAGALVSMLTHVAAHREGLVDSGISPGALRRTVAQFLTWAAGGDPSTVPPAAG